MPRLELNETEAEEILRLMYRRLGGDWPGLPATQRVAVVLGFLNSIAAMQELGYRIARPLEQADPNPPARIGSVLPFVSPHKKES